MNLKAVLLSSDNFGSPAEFPQKPPELQRYSFLLLLLSPWQKTLKTIQQFDLDYKNPIWTLANNAKNQTVFHFRGNESSKLNIKSTCLCKRCEAQYVLFLLLLEKKGN